MLARLAGKEALQAKRFGLITADDVWGGRQLVISLRHKPIMSAPPREP